MGIINKPHTFSPSTTASSSEVNADFDTLYNEFNGSIAAANLATDAITTSKIADSNVTTAKIADSNVTTAKINDDAVTAAKIDWAATGANGGIWWEELGRTTLGSTADTITVSSLANRKYIQILVYIINSGSINCLLRFNGDTAGNYGYGSSINGGAAGTASAATSIQVSDSGSNGVWAIIKVVNISTRAKKVMSQATRSGETSAAPSELEGNGVWANTSDAISSVTVTHDSTGDFLSGSEVIVLGHN